MLKFIASLSFALLITACGKEITDAKPGWTEEKVDSLIACQPRESKVCQCAIGQITLRYTPEQVKEKSPYVAADMLSIRSGCSYDEAAKPMHPTPSPTPGPKQ